VSNCGNCHTSELAQVARNESFEDGLVA